MKKILLILFTAVSLVGCTLEEEVISRSEPSTYYQTVSQCKTGLNGCYMPLRSIYASYRYFEVCEVATDLMYHSSTSSYRNASCDYSPTEPQFGSTLWNQGYLGVMRCNAMYAAIERAPLSDEEKAPLFAECVILRAFYYYILTINFGNVPYYFEEVTDKNNERISLLPRMDAKVLRDKLMDQLSYWIGPAGKEWEPLDDEYKVLLAEYKRDNLTEEGEEPVINCRQGLPYIKTYDPINDYRIGSMVGFVIAGKLAMWNKRYDKAIEYYGHIEDVYGWRNELGEYDPSNALADYPISDVMFRNKYTPESIFEIPGYSKDYGMNVTSALAAHCMPRRSSTTAEGDAAEDDGEDFEDELAGLEKIDDMYNGIRIPELGKEARISKPYRPTKYFYTELMPYTASKDPQKKWDQRRSVYDASKYATFDDSGVIYEVEGGGGWLAWCYAGWAKDDDMTEVPRHMLMFSGAQSKNAPARPYLGDKFWCPGMVYNKDSNNLKVFRLAHVLLDLAEANMRRDDWELAVSYLNASRNRVGLTPFGAEDLNSEEKFMEELQKESGRELFGEYTRRHNLIRWGIWRDNILKYSDNSLLKSNVQARPYLEYYPIPEEQVILSNRMLDNNKYDGIEE